MLRPAQTANRDGGFELGWGAALVLFGFGPYLHGLLPRSLWISTWTAWISYLPLLGAAFAPYAIPKLVQRLITWPRAGYVANPNDPKLGYLVTLMVFGGALGFALSLPFVLVSEIRQALSQTGPHSDLHRIILDSIKLVFCAALALYLGPKVIRKRTPLPAAYDAAMIAEGLKQTAPGRRHLRLVKVTILGMLIGLPLLVFGVVFALMYWGGSAFSHPESQASSTGLPGLIRQPESHWAQLLLPGFLVSVNVVLYLMGSGVLLKPHRWKWLIVPVLLIAPILIAPIMPFPAGEFESGTIFGPSSQVMLCLGAVWCLSGALTLMLFMRRNPVPSA